jgi:hypothetical protein
MSKDLVPTDRYNLGRGQFLVYEAEDGQVKIDVRLEDETVWLTQQLMADLFQTTKQNIGQHLKNVFSEGELREDSVVKKFFTTAADGKRYRTNFYNLDAIISVGYRVKSHVATRFRIWATQRLREYIIKGFVLDDERLKNPDQPFDYFEETRSSRTELEPSVLLAAPNEKWLNERLTGCPKHSGSKTCGRPAPA